MIRATRKYIQVRQLMNCYDGQLWRLKLIAFPGFLRGDHEEAEC